MVCPLYLNIFRICWFCKYYKRNSTLSWKIITATLHNKYFRELFCNHCHQDGNAREKPRQLSSRSCWYYRCKFQPGLQMYFPRSEITINILQLTTRSECFLLGRHIKHRWWIPAQVAQIWFLSWLLFSSPLSPVWKLAKVVKMALWISKSFTRYRCHLGPLAQSWESSERSPRPPRRQGSKQPKADLSCKES